MISNERGRHLHNRATLGASLSDDEQLELNAWYQQLDQEERALLSHSPGPRGAAEMRAQLDAALAELQAVVHRIRQIESENESLKAQIAALQGQLGFPKTMQPA
jgi:hypothetical protein